MKLLVESNNGSQAWIETENDITAWDDWYLKDTVRILCGVANETVGS